MGARGRQGGRQDSGGRGRTSLGIMGHLGECCYLSLDLEGKTLRSFTQVGIKPTSHGYNAEWSRGQAWLTGAGWEDTGAGQKHGGSRGKGKSGWVWAGFRRNINRKDWRKGGSVEDVLGFWPLGEMLAEVEILLEDLLVQFAARRNRGALEITKNCLGGSCTGWAPSRTPAWSHPDGDDPWCPWFFVPPLLLTLRVPVWIMVILLRLIFCQVRSKPKTFVQ